MATVQRRDSTVMPAAEPAPCGAMAGMDTGEIMATAANNRDKQKTT